MEVDSDEADPREFMKTLRTDLFEDEVHVFTPKGQVKTLPAGSTPIDFAYAVHTDVGHQTVGAKVNGRIVPLHYRLKNGDFVEILTSKQGRGPSRDWISLAKSSRARNKIRQWFSRETREDQEQKGRDALEQALKQQNLPYAKLRGSAVLAQVIRDSGFKKAEDFYVALGSGKLPSGAIVNKVIQRLKTDEVAEEAPVVTKAPRARDAVSGEDVGVVVQGVDDVLVRLAKCCTPVPGDPIVGYISLGKGITIHREDCPNVKALQRNEERFTPIEWDGDGTKSFRVQIAVALVGPPAPARGRRADVRRARREHRHLRRRRRGPAREELVHGRGRRREGAALAAERAARARRRLRRLPRHAVIDGERTAPSATRTRSRRSPSCTSARGPSYPAERGRLARRARLGLAAGPRRRRPRGRHRQADAAARAERRAGDRGRAARRDARACSRGSCPEAEAVDGTAEALPLEPTRASTR